MKENDIGPSLQFEHQFPYPSFIDLERSQNNTVAWNCLAFCRDTKTEGQSGSLADDLKKD